MASSTVSNISVADTWTQVSTSKATVVLTNPVSLAIEYAVAGAASDLTGVTGHTIDYKQTVTLSDLGTSGNNVFVRATNVGGAGKVIVTSY